MRKQSLYIIKMKQVNKPIEIMVGVYLICYAARVIDYFLIRTDQTVIGGAFLHKVFGILVLTLVVKMLHLKVRDIGFTKEHAAKNVVLGLLFGLSMFAIGYITEIALCVIRGNFVSVDFFVSSYAVDKNIFTKTSVLFIIICLLGNVLNVWMEEGVFRGLFQNLLETKFSFVISGIISNMYKAIPGQLTGKKTRYIISSATGKYIYPILDCLQRCFFMIRSMGYKIFTKNCSVII